MMTRKPAVTRLYTGAALGAVCLLAVLTCLFLYAYDNKYTAAGPQGKNGVLLLDAQTLRARPVLFLTEGWAYYGGVLLTPEDFTQTAPTPDAYIFIGQYGGFETGDITAPPHGSASYRLTVVLPDQPEQYLLELPEIFSAYRAYLNGRLVQTMGDPDPATYRPATGNRTVPVEAAGRLEILIAVSDFSHIYSGLTYPPAFGDPVAVAGLLATRLIFRSLPAAFALAIGLLSLFIGLLSGRTLPAALRTGTPARKPGYGVAPAPAGAASDRPAPLLGPLGEKRPLTVLYGVLCLTFIGYIAYPLIKTLTSTFYPFYALEQFSFCAMLATVLLLERSIFNRAQKWDWAFIGFGGFMGAAALSLPFFLTGGNLLLMAGYSWLVTIYEWLAALYLTLTAARALWGDTPHSGMLLGGVLIFDTALVMDRLLPQHEPILTGWFPEVASFALVLGVGLVVAQEVAAQYRANAVLTERTYSLEHLSELQRTNYELLRESVEESKIIRHDLRHHFIALNGFLQNRDYKSLEAYLRQFPNAGAEVSPAGYSQNPVVNILVAHYARQAQKEGVVLTPRLEISAASKVAEADLCAILSNLLENALEACARQETGQRFIKLTIGQKPSVLVIRLENSAAGNLTQSGGGYPSSKAKNRKGYGLDSIQTIAARYDGEAEFKYDQEKKTFTSTVVLLRQP